jgi:putative DNA primase/helicase
MDKKVIRDYFEGNYEKFYGKYLQLGKPSGSNNVSARCPFPGHTNDDKSPSFTFNTENGTYLCHGCGKKGHAFHFYAKLHGLDTKNDFGKILQNVADDFGIPWQERKFKVVKEYDYHDPAGNQLFQVCRMEPKDFRQRQPDGNSGWKWNLKGLAPVLYRLPQVVASPEVILVEGEKDADAVTSLGFCGTTCPMGARKWKDTYNESLKGKNVILIPDNDVEGREHMMQVGASLNGIVSSLKWLELPDVPNKGDFSDWLLKFHDTETAAERFSILLENAKDYDPPKPLSIEDAVLDDVSFSTIELPQKRDIVAPWLQEQTITLVPGWRGVGKTWWGMGIVDAVTRGLPSFGPWQVAMSVPCLYLEAEMAAEDVRERFKDLNPSMKREAPLYILSGAYLNHLGLPQPNLYSETFRKKMKSILMTRDVKIFVLDNLASLTPGGDENTKKDWDPINQWLLDLRFAGIATLIKHHTNKTGDQRGTSAREDNLDNSITLRKPHDYTPEDGAKFICHFKKARVRQKDLHMITDCQFQLSTDENNQLAWTWGGVKKENKIEVLKYINEGHKQTETADILGLSKGYVSKIVASATKDNLLTNQGKLTQSGFKFVQSDENEETF